MVNETRCYCSPAEFVSDLKSAHLNFDDGSPLTYDDVLRTLEETTLAGWLTEPDYYKDVKCETTDPTQDVV